MPMKPTRALEISESTPSSIPTPARRIGQTATFLPLIRGNSPVLERRLDVDVLGRQVLRRLVGQEQRDLVDELAEVDGRRVLVPQVRELVLDERVLDLDDLAVFVSATVTTRRRSSTRGSRDRAAASRRALRFGRARASRSGESPSAATMIATDLAEVVGVHAAHRCRRAADAHAARDRRLALVERNRVAVDGQLHLVQPLLRVLAGPVGARRSSCSRCVSVPPVSTSSPPAMSVSASVSALRRTCVW